MPGDDLCVGRLLHLFWVRALDAGAPGAAEAAAENLDAVEHGRGHEQQPLDAGQAGAGARRAADGPAAEEEGVEEDGQGDHAAEVEDDVEELEAQGGPRVGDCFRLSVRLHTVVCLELRTLRQEPRGTLNVEDGQNGKERGEDQEVDLRRRRRQGVDIVPVGH